MNVDDARLFPHELAYLARFLNFKFILFVALSGTLHLRHPLGLEGVAPAVLAAELDRDARARARHPAPRVAYGIPALGVVEEPRGRRDELPAHLPLLSDHILVELPQPKDVAPVVELLVAPPLEGPRPDVVRQGAPAHDEEAPPEHGRRVVAPGRPRRLAHEPPAHAVARRPDVPVRLGREAPQQDHGVDLGPVLGDDARHVRALGRPLQVAADGVPVRVQVVHDGVPVRVHRHGEDVVVELAPVRAAQELAVHVQILRILLGPPRFARAVAVRPAPGLVLVGAGARLGVRAALLDVSPVDALLPRLVARPRRVHLEAAHLLVELVV